MGEVALVPHKSSFKLRGKIVGMSNDNFYKEGTGSNGKEWRRINFGIMTTPESRVFVELFGMEMDYAYAYSKKEKKTQKINWEDRNNKGKIMKGYNLIEPDWDKIERIKEEFQDEDDVVVVGEIQYSEYNDNLQQRFVVKNIYKTSEPINFETDKEENVFTQELTITGVEHDKENGKLIINAYIIEGRGKNNPPVIQPAQFVVEIERNKKFAATIGKMKFGTTLKASGYINHRAVTEEVVDDQGEEFGEFEETNTVTNYFKELVIKGVDGKSIQKKLYKEEDFAELLAAQEEEKLMGQDDSGDNEGEFGEQVEDNENDLPFSLDGDDDEEDS